MSYIHTNIYTRTHIYSTDFLQSCRRYSMRKLNDNQKVLQDKSMEKLKLYSSQNMYTLF